MSKVYFQIICSDIKPESQGAAIKGAKYKVFSMEKDTKIGDGIIDRIIKNLIYSLGK